jgi:hypothetical protein
VWIADALPKGTTGKIPKRDIVIPPDLAGPVRLLLLAPRALARHARPAAGREAPVDADQPPESVAADILARLSAPIR